MCSVVLLGVIAFSVFEVVCVICGFECLMSPLCV